MAVPDFQALAQPGIQRLRAYDPGHDLVALRERFNNKGSASGAAGFLIELGSNEKLIRAAGIK